MGGPKNDVSFASTSTGMKQVLDFLKHIKAKLLKSSNKKEDSRKLQIQFYSHIKSWLAPRVSTVLETELNDLLGRMDTFDSAIEDLEAPESDEEFTLMFKTLCENIIESCKKDFPLKNLNWRGPSYVPKEHHWTSVPAALHSSSVGRFDNQERTL